MWRPKGWENPYVYKNLEAKSISCDIDFANVPEMVAYEAGADTMLESLRKEGYVKFDKVCPYCGASTRLECGFCSCNRYPIDIPDKEG